MTIKIYPKNFYIFKQNLWAIYLIEYLNVGFN